MSLQSYTPPPSASEKSVGGSCSLLSLAATGDASNWEEIVISSFSTTPLWVQLGRTTTRAAREGQECDYKITGEYCKLLEITN